MPISKRRNSAQTQRRPQCRRPRPAVALAPPVHLRGVERPLRWLSLAAVETHRQEVRGPRHAPLWRAQGQVQPTRLLVELALRVHLQWLGQVPQWVPLSVSETHQRKTPERHGLSDVAVQGQAQLARRHPAVLRTERRSLGPRSILLQSPSRCGRRSTPPGPQSRFQANVPRIDRTPCGTELAGVTVRPRGQGPSQHPTPAHGNSRGQARRPHFLLPLLGLRAPGG